MTDNAKVALRARRGPVEAGRPIPTASSAAEE